jgi:hypothetical protein
MVKPRVSPGARFGPIYRYPSLDFPPHPPTTMLPMFPRAFCLVPVLAAPTLLAQISDFRSFYQ